MATAECLLDSIIDPRLTQTLLATAARIANRRQEKKQTEAQGDQNKNQGLDTLAGRLATSMAPVVDGGSRTQPKRAEHFDPDLFLSQPDMAEYFAHADELREAGAKFLIYGPPGSGKTAIASELARRLKFRSASGYIRIHLGNMEKKAR